MLPILNPELLSREIKTIITTYYKGGFYLLFL
jgi:hypothetical protein